MIQATELRIGNWVLELAWDEDAGGNIVGDPEGDQYVHVTVGLLKYINDGNPPPSGITRYEGIPLTPEILEKAGFESIYTNEYRIAVDLPNSSYFIVGFVTGIPMEGFYSNGVYLKYVHQLQNIFFSLCGEELAINF